MLTPEERREALRIAERLVRHAIGDTPLQEHGRLVARALLAAEQENAALRKALTEIDEMPVEESARNEWTREMQRIARRAVFLTLKGVP